MGTGGWHCWAQVGGTSGRHCWAQVGGTAGQNWWVALLGTDQGTDHQCPDDRCRSLL
ncbi:unnamed protein product [Staurois parvus]|uniref:Uncharacterized protein n=1 Tax=Staurois parvus TaxID=386267 RepID=A0ABN9GEK1_9NEOB|nr:unnamed protein product [Staurois parvus]